jgi:hypothetical protein
MVGAGAATAMAPGSTAAPAAKARAQPAPIALPEVRPVLVRPPGLVNLGPVRRWKSEDFADGAGIGDLSCDWVVARAMGSA